MTMDGAKIQAKGGSVSRIPPPFVSVSILLSLQVLPLCA